jgi:dTMP kinase
LTRRQPLLIAAEGLDRAGTDALLELLGRWLERKGFRVRTLSWLPSRMVRRAAASRRTRTALSPTVAALLAAAEAEGGVLTPIRQALGKRDVVLVDHYAWTEIARQAARGADAGWVGRLYAEAPRPDLVIYARQSPERALELTMRQAPAGGALAAAAASFHDFLERATARLDALAAAAADRAAIPWPVPVVVVDASRATAAFERVREVVRPMLTARARTPLPSIPVTRRSLEPVATRGSLVVLEGIDHAGRSTHAALLEKQLRYRGRGVVRTSFGGSLIAGDLMRRAKAERGSDSQTLLLLYAADLAERLEQIIRPALQAGLVVIADRYTFTPIARAIARGVDAGWASDVLGFAPLPDAVVLLEIAPALAAARSQPVAKGRAARNSTEATGDYIAFQAAVAKVLTEDAERRDFLTVDASKPTAEVERDIQRSLAGLLEAGATSRPRSTAAAGAGA